MLRCKWILTLIVVYVKKVVGGLFCVAQKSTPGRFVFYQLGFSRHTEKTACRFIFLEGVIMQEKNACRRTGKNVAVLQSAHPCGQSVITAV